MGVKGLREKRVRRKDVKTRTKNIKVAYMRNDCASFLMERGISNQHWYNIVRRNSVLVTHGS